MRFGDGEMLEVRRIELGLWGVVYIVSLWCGLRAGIAIGGNGRHGMAFGMAFGSGYIRREVGALYH